MRQLPRRYKCDLYEIKILLFVQLINWTAWKCLNYNQSVDLMWQERELNITIYFLGICHVIINEWPIVSQIVVVFMNVTDNCF